MGLLTVPVPTVPALPGVFVPDTAGIHCVPFLGQRALHPAECPAEMPPSGHVPGHGQTCQLAIWPRCCLPTTSVQSPRACIWYNKDMLLVFADDTRQHRTARPGMRPLVGIGGLLVPGDVAAELERELDKLCLDTGFPKGEPFKWSPRADHWMRDSLTGQARTDFFITVLSLLRSARVKAIVVLEDIEAQPATGTDSHELDATMLFLERVHNFLERRQTHGIVVVDRPGGGRSEEEQFLSRCLEVLQSGTDYVTFYRISHVLSGTFNFIRLLQAADVITSCTASLVAGHETYTKPVFEHIRPLFDTTSDGLTGGAGLKIHPAGRYLNLYYWLLGDEGVWRNNIAYSLPLKGYPYFKSPYDDSRG